MQQISFFIESIKLISDVSNCSTLRKSSAHNLISKRTLKFQAPFTYIPRNHISKQVGSARRCRRRARRRQPRQSRGPSRLTRYLSLGVAVAPSRYTVAFATRVSPPDAVARRVRPHIISLAKYLSRLYRVLSEVLWWFSAFVVIETTAEDIYTV